MEAIGEEVRNLDSSPLYPYRKENDYHPVIGEGNLNADAVFVGEAPGKNEAESGRPFCGRAGKILDGLLETAGLDREEVYITNIVKDRPPKNRRPTKKEVSIYSPFLMRQLRIIQPRLVVTLGKTAAEFAFEELNTGEEFSAFKEIEGKIFEFEFDGRQTLLFPLYHPAYAIYQRTVLQQMNEEFRKIPEFIGKNKLVLDKLATNQKVKDS